MKCDSGWEYILYNELPFGFENVVSEQYTIMAQTYRY
jgi:hypothetical protein